MTRPYGFQFDNSYTHLPEDLFSRCPLQPVKAPQMVLFNRALAGWAPALAPHAGRLQSAVPWVHHYAAQAARRARR